MDCCMAVMTRTCLLVIFTSAYHFAGQTDILVVQKARNKGHISNFGQ